MKNIILLSALITGFIVLISCSSNTISNLMPQLKNADSVALMFYNSPNNPRFFKYVKIHDMRKLESVINDVNDNSTSEIPGCQTRGKIYFYGKKGVVDVVYFSNEEGCMTFSFIITGKKYFVRMSEKADKFLNEQMPMAKEPVSTN